MLKNGAEDGLETRLIIPSAEWNAVGTTLVSSGFMDYKIKIHCTGK